MEILYKIDARDRLNDVPRDEAVTIRWLDPARDLDAFVQHLRDRDPNYALSHETWKGWADSGIDYCGLFKGGIIVARAAVERYSAEAWETADVRVISAERGKGYAKQVCHFVTAFILDSGKRATCRTEEDNKAMRHIIHALGFEEM